MLRHSMPRHKSKRKRGRRGKRLGRAAGIRATGSLPAVVSLGDSDKLHTILRSVETLTTLMEKERLWKEARRAELSLLPCATTTNPLGKMSPEAKEDEKAKGHQYKGEVKIAWSDVEDSDSDESPFIQSPVVELSALRGLFKADRPYRTKLAFVGTAVTSAAGVLSNTATVASVTNVAQWSAFTTLFDECFVHGIYFDYQPFNRNATIPPGTASWASAGFGLPTQSANDSAYIYNAAMIWVSLFGASNAYATSLAGATQMENNPTRKHGRTDEPFKYAWKNNQRFDPHGSSLDPSSTSQGWCGWCECASAGNLSGFIQYQTVGAQVLGDGAHVINLGTLKLLFDVSFRERA